MKKEQQYRIKPGKVGNALIDTYYKIEDGVVGTYKKIEDGAVGTYKKIETAFVDRFLEKADTEPEENTENNENDD